MSQTVCEHQEQIQSISKPKDSMEWCRVENLIKVIDVSNQIKLRVGVPFTFVQF